MGVAATYVWLSEQLDLEFEKLRMLKESPRGSVELIRHRESRRKEVHLPRRLSRLYFLTKIAIYVPLRLFHAH